MSSPLLPDPYLLKTPDRRPVLVLTLGLDSLTTEPHADDWFQQGRSAIRASGVRQVLIDCEQVELVYASGLNKILKIYRELYQAGGELALCRLPDTFQEVLRMTRMDKVLKLFPSLEAAIEALLEGA